MKKMKISVAVIAYNQEEYIAQCLDSILMQKGDFDLDVIVGDDYSTDKTGQIVQEYREKHPHRVIVLSTTANIGAVMNFKRCLEACSGDYIATCDGDDYWTDPYKLLKQAEFLESHPDYSLCFNAMITYVQQDNRYHIVDNQMSCEKDTLTIEDLIENNYIGNSSVCMYRASITRKLPEELFGRYYGDWAINMACGRMGKIGFLRDWMSVYRKHSGGIFSGSARLDNLHHSIAAIDNFNELFGYEYDSLFRRKKEAIERQIDWQRKQLETERQRVSSTEPNGSSPTSGVGNPRKALRRLLSPEKLYGSLLIRVLRHPRKALNRLRAAIREETSR